MLRPRFRVLKTLSDYLILSSKNLRSQISGSGTRVTQRKKFCFSLPRNENKKKKEREKQKNCQCSRYLPTMSHYPTSGKRDEINVLGKDAECGNQFDRRVYACRITST